MKTFLNILFLVTILVSCSSNDNSETTNCVSSIALDNTRGAANETLNFIPEYTETPQGTFLTITANSIPNHKVGLFGSVAGALNPNAIAPQSETYNITTTPLVANTLTPLLGTNGPNYSFGILLNGVELDPIAAEPFPHEKPISPSANWHWNLEALNVNLGLDTNNAHVQPSGKYHYHGTPTGYLSNANIPNNQMTLIGYAGDGFPIYYKYAYSNTTDATSEIIEMIPSYQLKQGERPGDGITAPCGAYNGVYSNDYEFIENLGDLDQANGRTGVTPEYPLGTYYYVITTNFPSIPRYFRGTPSNDFKIGL